MAVLLFFINSFFMAENIGIFGGTFDPPHLGHLILAAEALAQLRLGKVLWVLTPQPPHKPVQPISPVQQRLEMLQRMLTDTPGFELSKVEMNRPGPHYMLDTVDALQEQYPRDNMVLLIGGDSLRDLPTWHHAPELVTAVHTFGVMGRPGAVYDLPALEVHLRGISAKVRMIETPQMDISSSSIRERIKSGRHYRYFLHPGVYDYIVQQRLYQ